MISKLFLATAIFLLGCGGSGKKKPSAAEENEINSAAILESDAAEAYFYALNFFKKRDYKRADTEFYSFLQLYPNSRYYLAGWVAYAESLQHQGLWIESVEAFRRVSGRVTNVRSQLKARAMMSISFSYEMLSENEKALTALFDSVAYKKGLSEVEKNVLIPARMATVYARLGNRKQAEKYAMRANRAVQLIRNKGVFTESDKYNFADLLFRMGRNPIGSAKRGKTEDIIFGLQVSQEFLQQSLESGQGLFPQMIEKELIVAYDEIMSRFERTENINQAQLKQRWAISILEALDRFRYSRLPKTPLVAEKNMEAILEKFELIEKKVFAWIAENSIDVRRTSEEETRSGLKREGRIIDEHILRSMRRKPYLLIDLDEEFNKDPNL